MSTAADLSSARVVSNHAAAIEQNLAFWSRCGAAVVRRDHELADQAANLVDKTADRAYARVLESGRFEPGPREYQQSCGPPATADPFAAQYVGAAGYLDGDYVAEQLDLSAEDLRFAFSAEGAYAAVCQERTGEFMEEDELKKRRRQAAQLLKLSEELTAKMATAPDPAALLAMLDDAEILAVSAGADPHEARKAFEPIAREIAPRFNAYRDTPFELWRYYVHSRQIDILPNFRRLRFIPSVAQTLRAPMVSALEYWLSRNVYARFWTFTSGGRVKLSGIRDRTRWLSYKLNRLNAAKFMQEAGVEIVFRSIEMGTPETDEHGNTVDGGEIETDADGQMYFHVHAHCVLELKKGHITPPKWKKLLERVHAFWPFHWRDDGVIGSAREVCKYVTKPAEMRKLSADDLIALEEQLSGLHLVQAMGSLAVEYNQRKADRERVVKRKTPDGRVYFVVKDWNRHARRTKIEESQDAAQKLTPITARRCVNIVSRGTPRFGRAGVAEPCVTVMFIRGSWDENAVRIHPLVAPVIGITERQFFAGVRKRAAAACVDRINVHTRTVTVLPERPARPRGKPKRQRIGAERAGF